MSLKTKIAAVTSIAAASTAQEHTMKHLVRTALATGMAAVALGTFAGSASADARAGTPDQKHWYIGTGNAYGDVTWNDHDGGLGDADVLTLNDDVFPSGYSVRMTVKQGSWKKTVRASSGGQYALRIPGFTKGEKATFKACAWDNGHEVMCRKKTTITE